MRLAFAPYLLRFKEPGGTSRGVLTEKPTFLIKIYDESDPERFGIGEAAVFPGLSPEADGSYVNKLLELMANVALGRKTDLSHHSSIQFGLEQAVLDFSNGCKGIYYPGDFTEGKSEIIINGLIWMGDYDEMIQRIGKKIEEGFSCLKLKIGAIDWEKELQMLSFIRKHYGSEKLTLRVDANGAFRFDDAFKKLNQLAEFDIHSIEQPIKAGNPDYMAKLCKESPVAIALDEELIAKGDFEERKKTLENIKPQYIILKPALCGGFSGASEWISLAEENHIGWWITSALESNVGLNAIAQWTSYVGASGPQGLGTGEVFSNNFDVPIERKSEKLFFNPEKKFDYSQFYGLTWHS